MKTISAFVLLNLRFCFIEIPRSLIKKIKIWFFFVYRVKCIDYPVFIVLNIIVIVLNVY